MASAHEHAFEIEAAIGASIRAMGATGIIPARHASTRFPGKPLADIAGRPMIEHVWRGARSAKRLSQVVVATDDERIGRVCDAIGARWLMTSPDHATGSDRLAEAVDRLGLPDDEIVVNIQGDEPLIEGRIVDAVVERLELHPEAAASTVVHPIDAKDASDPNRVKVVLDRDGFALYFSRSVVPARRNPETAGCWWQHIGIYGYRAGFLREYVKLPRTPAERAEELEQLRILEHGHRISVATIEGWTSLGVDTPADRDRIESRLRR